MVSGGYASNASEPWSVVSDGNDREAGGEYDRIVGELWKVNTSRAERDVFPTTVHGFK